MRSNPECLTQAIELEDAFNLYREANDSWSDCIADIDCDIDADVLPKMRSQWDSASTKIEKAARGLEQLRP